jgi:cold shock CspA family protein
VLVHEGYGFLLTDEGERVYFHRNCVRDPLRFEQLDEGQRVSLQVEAGEKGMQATVVAAPPLGAPAP